MKLSGWLAVGNGEKCPFCDVILDNRPNHDSEDIAKHLFAKHEKEVGEAIFGKAKKGKLKGDADEARS